jgi:uroporphyrinogen-III synthase
VSAAQPRQILVTRPAAEAHETAQRLRRMGWEPILAPVLHVEPRALALDPTSRPPQAVLVTSGNALTALPPALHPVRLLAVGDATAARARAAGFADVGSAGRDAAALLALAASCCDPAGASLLLAAGEGQGLDLAAALRQRGFRVRRRVAYAAWPVAALPPAALAALAAGEVSAAMFFSPASGRAFAAVLGRARQTTALRSVTAVAISPATAAALTPLPWRDIRVASAPNQDELLACLR